ncbi:MAG: hypothetical protein A2Z66_10135 [Chloroflexi bacterium RBG_13_66_10]|jgi:hypothetical protein|nr:MAG: hypothetical protein A2Z66_10135 [Chloroflexi bacterium RBG_13_66_10]
MIQVRDSFQIRFGKIDQAVDLFLRLPKEVPEVFQPAGARIELLSDISGPMYTLHEAMHFESLESWDGSLQALFARPEFQEWFKDWKQFVEDGSREFYRVEQDNGGWSGKGAVVVRSCFRALAWRVHDAVDLLKDHGAMLVDCGVGQRPRVLTDASGRMFNIVLEVETPDLHTWEQHRRTMFRDPSFQAWFQRLLTCMSHGSHEFHSFLG